MGFYHFSQNNSGGSFDFDAERGISHHVIVEGNSVEEVNARAESIGLYFDGQGDCPCCGNRWSECWSGERLDLVPKVYDKQVYKDAPYTDKVFSKFINGPEGFIHYLDGRIEPFWDNSEEV